MLENARDNLSSGHWKQAFNRGPRSRRLTCDQFRGWLIISTAGYLLKPLTSLGYRVGESDGAISCGEPLVFFPSSCLPSQMSMVVLPLSVTSICFLRIVPLR